jgi:hypothetical protein
MDMLTIESQKGDTEVIPPPSTARGGTARKEVPIFKKPSGTDASRLRKAVERSRQALAGKHSGSAEPLHRQLELAERERIRFWTDTCRDPRDAKPASRQVAELHRQFGWRFLTPSAQQVRTVLEALDRATTSWDQDKPALFFQTLELNFPGVLRLFRKP